MVANALGFRYLWNDSLCIVQDDEIDIDSQIDKMDAMNSQADLTIVAGSGAHADVGLPGVSVSRRFSQRSKIVKGFRLATILPKYAVVDEGLKLVWNTRGWDVLGETVIATNFVVY